MSSGSKGHRYGTTVLQEPIGIPTRRIGDPREQRRTRTMLPLLQLDQMLTKDPYTLAQPVMRQLRLDACLLDLRGDERLGRSGDAFLEAVCDLCRAHT